MGHKETNQPGTDKKQSSSGINWRIYKTTLPSNRKQNKPTGCATFTGWVTCTSHTLCRTEGLGWHPATATADHGPERVSDATRCSSVHLTSQAESHTYKQGIICRAMNALLHFSTARACKHIQKRRNTCNEWVLLSEVLLWQKDFTLVMPRNGVSTSFPKRYNNSIFFFSLDIFWHGTMEKSNFLAAVTAQKWYRSA